MSQINNNGGVLFSQGPRERVLWSRLGTRLQRPAGGEEMTRHIFAFSLLASKTQYVYWVRVHPTWNKMFCTKMWCVTLMLFRFSCLPKGSNLTFPHTLLVFFNAVSKWQNCWHSKINCGRKKTSRNVRLYTIDFNNFIKQPFQRSDIKYTLRGQRTCVLWVVFVVLRVLQK